jgi:hypothetical protein
MNIAELCQWQKDWETARRMDKLNSPDYNAKRTRQELDEYDEETDPQAKLMEAVDVLIVLTGGMYKLADELGLPYEKIDELVKLKLGINEEKYALPFYSGRSTEGAVRAIKLFWEMEPPTGNDVY